MPPARKRPVERKPKVTEQDPATGRWVRKEDTLERRRLSVEMIERGSSLSEIAAAHWSGDWTTARRQIDAWYAEHPNPDALTLRRVMTGKMANLEGIVRDVMERQHFVVDRGSVVLDPEGRPLVDDKPIYDGVDRILKIGDFLVKITPNMAAPKVTAEISGDAIEAAIAKAEADLAAELAALSGEEDGDDEA